MINRVCDGVVEKIVGGDAHLVAITNSDVLRRGGDYRAYVVMVESGELGSLE